MKHITQSIAIGKLIAHPGNANVMGESIFKKLVRNIEKTGRYEPVVVRPHPKKEDFFEIINGHHRIKALEQLGYKQVDCVVWDVDDEETEILLTTLNRLCGRDELSKRISLLKGLKKRMETRELAKLLPVTAKQIERLTNMRMPSAPVRSDGVSFLMPMVFFVTDEQKRIIEEAIKFASGDEISKSEIRNSKPETSINNQRTRSKTEQGSKPTTRTQKRAAAVTKIAEYFIGETLHK